MNKICVTILFGDYDNLKEPTVLTKGWKYIVISDREHKSNVWETKLLKDINLTNKRKTGYVITQVHKLLDYDVCLMVGAQIQINTNLDGYIYEDNFVALDHPSRDCIYTEAMACIMLNKDNPKLIASTIYGYLDAGLPPKSGMIQTGVTIRKNNNITNNFCDYWWLQICKGSHRDQLSFNYANWVYPIDYKVISSNLLNKEFKLFAHNSKNV